MLFYCLIISLLLNNLLTRLVFLGVIVKISAIQILGGTKPTTVMKTIENDMAPKSSYDADDAGSYVVITVAIETPIEA